MLKTVDAFSTLGKLIEQELNQSDSGLQAAMVQARIHNGWFTPSNMEFALKQWSKNLQAESLQHFLSPYTIPASPKTGSKKVGIILPGNLPLVGFHDLFCVLLSGHTCIAKLSSEDSHLIKYLVEKLTAIEPTLKERIHFTENLKNIDAVIATGSDNTNRYFEYYFGRLPHIFRKNRTSIAVLSGTETQEEMEKLSDDLFIYFGLGCRNVSKLFVPEKFDLDHFFDGMKKHSELIHHHKYANNYNYYRTIYSMKLLPYFDNGFIVLKEDESLSSPVSIVHFEKYSDLKQVESKLTAQRDAIQCVSVSEKLSRSFSSSLPLVSFGQTQHCDLVSYADGVDTMKFLLGLN